MSAPVFDPLSVGVDPVEASTEVLLALQAAYRQGAKDGFGHAWSKGYEAGDKAGHQQGFIEGHDHGITEGILKAKDSLERLAHGGK